MVLLADNEFHAFLWPIKYPCQTPRKFVVFRLGFAAIEFDGLHKSRSNIFGKLGGL